MKIVNYTLILIFIGLMLACMPSFADTEELNISWDSLNLNSRQEKRFSLLDKQWESMQSLIRPRLIRDQERLKLMLINPDVSDTQIRELQKQIFVRQEQLRYQALENFLSKRRLLNPKQRIILHEMFQSQLYCR